MPPVDVTHKTVVLRCLEAICDDGQLLVDIFVNYDCDLEGANLFERLVIALVRIAQGNQDKEAQANVTPEEQRLRLNVSPMALCVTSCNVLEVCIVRKQDAWINSRCWAYLHKMGQSEYWLLLIIGIDTKFILILTQKFYINIDTKLCTNVHSYCTSPHRTAWCIHTLWRHFAILVCQDYRNTCRSVNDKKYPILPCFCSQLLDRPIWGIICWKKTSSNTVHSNHNWR